MISYGLYRCPHGILVIGWDAEQVVSLKLCKESVLHHSPSPVSDLAAKEILEYLEGNRKEFTFPISPAGTSFQTAVWEALRHIPYGQTQTYGQIAAAIGRPGAARSVGQAANRNPIWIVIPCHRVIGSNGSLTGYAGGTELKQSLLELKKSHA